MPQDGLRAINVYVLETAAGLALIDGGWHRPDTYRELATGLARIGRSPDEIHDVFVTHVHRDHYTFAVELRRRHGCRVHLGAEESSGLEAIHRLGTNEPENALHELRRAGASDLASRARVDSLAEPFDPQDWEPPDHWLRPGTVELSGYRLYAQATPGHTKGHMVFRDLDRNLMFTGDHVLPTITPSIGFELGPWEMPLDNFLCSLTLLSDDDAPVMLPAHGLPGGSVGRRARALLAHHEHRFAQILTVVGDSASSTGSAVAQALTWTRHDRRFDTLGTFDQMFATCETLAHLDVLVARNVLTAKDNDGVDVFGIAR
ncbi:MBL fold metallo-hydrolase [Nocardia sp. NEAU-G5]|uniref:MBL fold metallo-hydrolase n=1 Tax=Nocardia albiluteola TaxID=2842303 RepID=A0ABS6BDW6_9NOCA|nr:MBL fold metallo-hydrolase [Nocardia albiluteola]MBU3067676.1 MBL fold metallo-hydrolase [Nocardia albiluteola]